MSQCTSPGEEFQSPRDGVTSPRRFWTSVSSAAETWKSPREKGGTEEDIAVIQQGRSKGSGKRRPWSRKHSGANVEELRGQLEAANYRATELQEQNNILCNQYEKAKESLQVTAEKNQKLQGEVSEAQSKLKEISIEKAKKTSELEKSRVEQEKLVKEHEQLSQELEKVSLYGAQVGKENLELKQEMRSLHEDLDQLNSKMEVLQGELSKAQAKFDSMPQGNKTASWDRPRTVNRAYPSQVTWYGAFCGLNV